MHLRKTYRGEGGAPYDPLLSTLTLDFQLFSVNSFRLKHFRKNASANPLESHTFKTKDLKPFRFIHFQKKGRGGIPTFDSQLSTVDFPPPPTTPSNPFSPPYIQPNPQ